MCISDKGAEVLINEGSYMGINEGLSGFKELD